MNQRIGNLLLDVRGAARASAVIAARGDWPPHAPFSAVAAAGLAVAVCRSCDRGSDSDHLRAMQASSLVTTVGSIAPQGDRIAFCGAVRVGGAAAWLQVLVPGPDAPGRVAGECDTLGAAALGALKTLIELQGINLEGTGLTRALAHAVLTAQDDERERLSHEIHDRIAQSLVAVFQQLQVVESMTETMPKISRAVVRCSTLTRQVTREVRTIISDLYPPGLVEMGLGVLIAEDLRHFAEQSGCRVKTEALTEARFEREVELTIYRIFREAVMNVQRHAQAKRLQVGFTQSGGEVTLRVVDDGVGFAFEAMRAHRIGGLRIMQRRAELAGGTCEVESQPGRGERGEGDGPDPDLGGRIQSNRRRPPVNRPGGLGRVSGECRPSGGRPRPGALRYPPAVQPSGG